MNTANWTIEKLYQLIANHQLTGVMFHTEASQYLRFLGLKNLAELQHNQALDEWQDLECTEDTYLQRHGLMLVPAAENYDKLTPAEALSTKVQTVGREFKRKTLSHFIERWTDWENETEVLYSTAVKWCIENGCADMLHFKKLLCDVCKEKARLICLRDKMSLSDWDLVASENLVYDLSTDESKTVENHRAV